MFFLRGEEGGLKDFRTERRKRDALVATPGDAGGMSGREESMWVGGDRVDGG